MLMVVTVENSYADVYKLVYLSNGWKILYKYCDEVGAYNGQGGVYSAANFFGV